jgi:hypothetical protein
MGRPRIKVPATPPPPPIAPVAPIYEGEQERLKKKLFDPRRVGRQQTILTGPQGLLGKTQRKKLGAGDTPKNT